MAQYEPNSHHHQYFGPHGKDSSHGHYIFNPRSWSSSHHDPTTPHAPHRSHLSEMLHRPKHHRRHPPPPSVEDEVRSLAKEHPPQHVPESDVQSRGTVDQEPILIELESNDRRFVLVSHASDPSAQSDQHRHRESLSGRVGRKSSNPALKLDTAQPNLLDRRKPAPYSYSRSSSSLTPSGEYFPSPDNCTPLAASSLPRSAPTKECLSPSTKKSRDRTSVTSSGSNTSYQTESDDSDLDAREVFKRRSRHESRGSRGSYSETRDSKNRNGSFGSYSTARPPSLRAELSRASIEASLATRDAFPSDGRSGSRTPRASRVDNPASWQEAVRRDVRSDPSWNDTLKMDIPRQISIPSPGLSTPGSPKFGNTSVPSSPHGSVSRQDSRPSSPQSAYDVFAFEPPRGQYDRSASYGVPSQPKVSNIPPRLGASIRHNSTESLSMPPRIDIQSSSPARGGKLPLPYPDDDATLAMPSVLTFQPQPERSGSSLEPKLGYHRTASMSSNGSYSSTPKARPVMPNPPSRQTSAVSSSGSRTPSSTSEDESTSRSLKKSSSSAPDIPTNLPACPRMESLKGYDDWHCLEGYSDFDICPTCYYEIVRPTPFRKFFVQSPRRPASVSIRCDFGKPWTRLAWLLTYKQQRQDLGLIYALVNVAAKEPGCPGDKEAVGNWYGVQDRAGAFVPGFSVCPRDKRYIEALFPSLVGTFTRISGSTPRTASLCSVRTQSRRFPVYLDMLDAMHDNAVKTSSSSQRPRSPNSATIPSISGTADPRPLIDLARSYASTTSAMSTSVSSNTTRDGRQQPQARECLRDNVQHDALWHIIPEFPEFTVCESCFDSVVWPAVKRGSAIADRFTRTVQPLPAPVKKSVTSLNQSSGQTCQLYSSRMRRIWDRAVHGGDLHLLIRKVRERKEAEVELRKQRTDILRLLGSLRGIANMSSPIGGYTSGIGGVDREKLRKELERVERQWEDWE